MSTAPVLTVNLEDADVLRTTGVCIDVVLPSGRVIDLWAFEVQGGEFATCSLDVRQRTSVDATEQVPVVRTIQLPGVVDEPVKCVAVVLA